MLALEKHAIDGQLPICADRSAKREELAVLLKHLLRKTNAIICEIIEVLVCNAGSVAFGQSLSRDQPSEPNPPRRNLREIVLSLLRNPAFRAAAKHL